MRPSHEAVTGSVASRLAALPDCTVITDDDVVAGYTTDWTGRWTGSATAVVRPKTATAVAAVLNCCDQAGVAVVPQGGNTGLVGGSVPPPGSIVLSTRSLTGIGDVGPDNTITVGAGTTLVALEDAANRNGLTCGLGLASGESATVGGVLATNAGGARVLRYGTARARAAGVRAVTMNGDIVDRLHQLPKDNTGFDLTNVIIGSEGTLAVITDVRWRLERRDREKLVAVFSFPSAADAVDAVPRLLDIPGICALEWAAGRDVERVARETGAPAPVRTDGFWVFAEIGSAGRPGAHDGELFDVVEPILDEISAVLAEDRIAIGFQPAEQRRLWAYRERMTETINAAGVPVKLDVGVPMSEFARITEEVGQVVGAVVPDADVALFGHLAEGNLHINLLSRSAERRFSPEDAERAERAVLEFILSVGGTVSAEHGIGRAKRDWLSAQRGVVQTSLMRAIKQGWDPHGLLNPGALFEPS